MGMKVKAIERNIAFDKSKEHYAYVMQPELYGQLEQSKVIEQAALNSGMPKPAMQSAVNAYGEVVKAWATEGHSVPIPGLGCMRFGLRSSAVDTVEEVKADLITSRRIIFTPNTSLKKVLGETAISITCYDRNGKVVKTITSDDSDDVEDSNDAKDNTGGNTDDSTKTDTKTDDKTQTSGSGSSDSQSGSTGDNSDSLYD